MPAWQIEHSKTAFPLQRCTYCAGLPDFTERRVTHLMLVWLLRWRISHTGDMRHVSTMKHWEPQLKEARSRHRELGRFLLVPEEYGRLFIIKK